MKTFFSLLALFVITLSVQAQTIPVYLQKRPATTYFPLPTASQTALRLTDVQDYGHFVIARIPTSDAATFAARAAGMGLTGKIQTAFNEIRLRDFTIPDGQTVAAGLPPDLQISDYSGASGQYLVQFRSPARPVWLTQLRAADVRVLQYYPENTYLVAVAPARRSVLATLPGYRADVVYQPAYKLERTLRAAVDTTRRRVVMQIDAASANGDLIDAVKAASSTAVTSAALADYVDLGATLSPAALRTFALDPRTVWIEPARRIGLSDERFAQILAGNFTLGGATNPTGYISFLSSKGLWDTSEYIVNVIDGGLDSGQGQPIHPDLAGRIASWQAEDYTCCGETSDSYGHGTMVAGVIAGNPLQAGGTQLGEGGLNSGFYYGMGIAPTVRLRITDIYDKFNRSQWNTTMIPGELQNASKNAWNAGARFQNLSNNLYGAGGSAASYDYDTYAQTVDLAVRDSYAFGRLPYAAPNPMFISLSAGNFTDAVSPGTCPRCVLRPATAKNAVVMGSSSEVRDPYNTTGCGDSFSVNDVSAFSGRRVFNEPTRVKPDFVAPGTRIVSTWTGYRGDNYTPGGATCPKTSAGIISGDLYGWSAGTSFGAPQAAGTAVLLSKRYKNLYAVDPSPAMIKAMMAIGADRLVGGTDLYTAATLTGTPGAQGWGRLNLASILDGTPSIAGDEDHGLPPYRRFTATGQSYTFTFTIADPSKPLKIALAFTDAAGAANATPAKVNELSMYVLQGGYTYCDGSYDANGYTPRSISCGPPDGINNLHVITIAPYSFAGQFQLQIRADNIAGMGVPYLEGRDVNQDFAAWVYNAQ